MGGPSPFAPATFPALPPIAGVRLGAVAAGVKYENRPDLFLALLDEGSVAAGVLTRSKTASAPVDWCREVLKSGRARAILVNAGNANAFTGKAGQAAVKHSVDALARTVGCRKSEVLVASTGVIGEKLPADRLTAALPALTKSLRPDAWEDAARAIMTTDTFPKGAAARVDIAGTQVAIAGIAKGSGMIAPDMATMLAFVFTDATLPADVLRKCLKRAADRSFNAITVDGDTSTSDTLTLCATGRAKHPRIASAGDRRLKAFRAGLEAVLRDLAIQVVKDGEGAGKFITVDVAGAASDKAARRIGLAIANSPLVKTAIAGEDANWGRVVMAVGKAGEEADRDRLSIAMGGVVIARNGEGVEGYDEAPVAAHLKGREIDIAVDVGVGKGRARVWTCDLTHGYIDINADYRS